MPPKDRPFPASLTSSTAFRHGESAPFRTSIQQDRHDALLDIAEKLLAEKGLLQTGMQEIGARLGFPPYAVRAQFGNKEMIVEAVLDRHLNRLIDRAALFESANAETDPTARLQLAILGLLETLSYYRHAQRVHTAAVSGAPPHLTRSLRIRQRHLLHYYAGLIVAAVPETQGQTELAMPLAMSLMAMACWHILWFRDAGALSRTEYATLLTNMIIAGARESIAEGVGAWAHPSPLGGAAS